MITFIFCASYAQYKNFIQENPLSPAKYLRDATDLAGVAECKVIRLPGAIHHIHWLAITQRFLSIPKCEVVDV